MNARRLMLLGVWLAACSFIIGCQPPAPESGAWTEHAAALADPVASVDPFIGTMIDHGQLDPAASVPFGMVKLGPDTLIPSHSGYDYAVPVTVGFSHVRLSGIGGKGSGGNLKVLPGIGHPTRFWLRIDKQTEFAEPGYYSADLGDGGPIHAEMTATQHVGLHRYTFRTDGNIYVVVNFNHPFNDWLGSEWAITDDDEVSGWVASKNVAHTGRYQIYFAMKFNRPIIAQWTWPAAAGGRNVRLGFGSSTCEPLMVRTGISTVSVEAARTDRDAEVPGWDFEAVRQEARSDWHTHLSVVEVDTDEEFRRLFYTMLYRTLHTPADVTTTGGRYLGTDGEIHVAEGYRRHHGWSLWDTYRTKFTVHNLLYPQRAGEIMQSLVAYYLEGKGDGISDFEPYPNVRGEHAPCLLLDAYRKGIGGFDFAPAMDAILAEPRPAGSPDREVNASFDHWAIAHLARIAGDEVAYEERIALSAAYRDVWREWFRDMGDDADIVHAHGQAEGTLWQNRWAPVHDLYGAMEIDGGREVFLEKLTYFFDNDLYSHNTEIDIQAPFLFVHAGAPWRMQDIVRKILSERMVQWYGTHEKWPIPAYRRIYRASPWGNLLNMDDDAGAMSGWFVLGSIGLLPVTVGQPIYVLAPPLFEQVVLHLEDGATFTILAPGADKWNRYVQSARLNGEDLPRAWLHHDEIVAGGELVFEMGTEANEDWGAAIEHAPPPAFE